MSGADGSRALVVVVDGDGDVVLGPLDAARPDLALVDALARLQLAAGRRGRRIGLRNADPELWDLLDLVGLGEIVAGRPGLPLEPGREAEGGEQLDVEEVVDPGDASR